MFGHTPARGDAIVGGCRLPNAALRYPWEIGDRSDDRGGTFGLREGMPLRRHSAEQIRHQRRRHISRRLKIVNQVWRRGILEGLPPGRLAKWNTSCNCWMCDKQNWPDTRPSTAGADLDFREALLDLAEPEFVQARWFH